MIRDLVTVLVSANALGSWLAILCKCIIRRTSSSDSLVGGSRYNNDGTLHFISLPLQLAFGREPNISHFRIFGCAVYVPVAPPQRTKMGPQRRLGIYVSNRMFNFNSHYHTIVIECLGCEFTSVV